MGKKRPVQVEPLGLGIYTGQKLSGLRGSKTTREGSNLLGVCGFLTYGFAIGDKPLWNAVESIELAFLAHFYASLSLFFSKASRYVRT